MLRVQVCLTVPGVTVLAENAHMVHHAMVVVNETLLARAVRQGYQLASVRSWSSV